MEGGVQPEDCQSGYDGFEGMFHRVIIVFLCYCVIVLIFCPAESAESAEIC